LIIEICSRSKKVLELGSGYGLAGLAVAASTNAAEVVISDGNPQVVGCILLKSFHAQIIFFASFL
jgi:tRNA1(Val) A37 N6-methylase TrmN6